MWASGRCSLYFRQHNLRAIFHWKSGDACSNRGKRDCLQGLLRGDAQGIGGGGTQGLRGSRATELHTRGVDHVARLQIAARRDGGPADGNCADVVAFVLNAAAAFATNRSGDAAAELQIIVGGIHDGVAIHFSDVTLANFNSIGEVHRRGVLF